MSERAPLASAVRTRTTDARLERQWAALEAAGLPGPARGGLRRGLAFASGAGLVLALLGAVAVLFAVQSRPPLAAGAMIASAQQRISVQLEDGSRVRLSPQSHLQLRQNRPADVELELQDGRARFEVTHAKARRFVVRLGPAEVRVIGTRFELSRSARGDGTLLGLSVIEGVVEVRRTDLPGEPTQRLHAGERWSVLLKEATPRDVGLEQARGPAQQPAVPPSDPVGSEPASDGRTEQPERAKVRAGSGAEGRTAATSEPTGAAAIFARATLARRAGRMRDAADAYAELLAKHPDDGRAGLSAFELGRIRMDALRDPKGAIAALEDALHDGEATSFHEDALARIVVASDALGDTAGCQRARARYLERHPNGVHTLALAARCR